MNRRLATVDGQPSIRRLLQKSGLPVDDLDTAAIEFFVITGADELIGVVGVEPFDTIGLLRSLAVRMTDVVTEWERSWSVRQRRTPLSSAFGNSSC